MSYIYCIRVNPETTDDVNLKFREAGLKGEVLATMEGKFFVSPQLSHKMWSAYPQSKEPTSQIDTGWDEAIADCVKLLQDNYGMAPPAGKADWQEIQSFRCTKMESFVREFDVVHTV
ncbi:MAG: hypothetical protein AAF702_45880 [Chloroflexota bacterium]